MYLRCLLMIAAVMTSSVAGAACRGGVCEMAIDVLKSKEFQHPALTANRSLVLGDSVVLKAAEDFASVVSHGEFMYVGKDATLGNLFHHGILQLQRPANVQGKIYARAPDKNRQDLVSAGFQVPDLPRATLKSAVEMPRNILTSAIDIEGGKALALEQGRYGKASVRQGKLRLKTGVYFFDRLDVGAGGEIELDNREGTAFVFVIEELRFKGRMAFQGAQSDLVLGYFGKQPVMLEGKFDAYLVAPDARVVLSPAPREQAHHLSIFADSIEVAAKTHVVRAIPTYKGNAFGKLARRNETREEGVVEDAAPDPEYLRGLAELPNGKLILAALDTLRWTNEDERLQYEKTLEQLRQNPELTVATFEKLNADIPDKVDSIDVRENLVLVLADLRVDQATHLLAEVGTRPVSPEILAAPSGHHDSTLVRDYSIRGLAFNGLRRLAKNGNGEAEGILLDTTLAAGDDAIRDSAAVAYLLSGDIDEQRRQLRRQLPASHQHLADITFDVGPLNRRLESLEQERKKKPR